MTLKNIYVTMVQLSVMIYLIYIIRNIIVMGILKTETQMTEDEINQETKDFPPKVVKFILILKKYPILMLIVYSTACFIPFVNILFAITELQDIIG